MVRAMTIDDYEEVYALWNSIEGFGIIVVQFFNLLFQLLLFGH